MYTLRSYQTAIVSKTQDDMSVPGNSLIVLATGAGKSLIISEVARWLRQPILILQPSVEILQQNKDKLLEVVDKDEIGIYSASAGEKTIKTFTLATIGSVYKKPEQFSHFKLVIIDECHEVNHKKLNTMYMSFLRSIGTPKVLGLTASPYRLESWGERMKNGWVISHTVTKMINRCMNPFWSRILVSIGTGDLIDAGYLCKPTYITKELIPREELKVNASHTDFNLTDFQKKLKLREDDLINTIKWSRDKHNHTLVFCVSVLQATELSNQVSGSAVVCADTDKKLRKKIIEDFKNGKIRVVFNVECLTTGFDFPSLDCIVVLRPTNSIRLHVQMLGRGVRIAEGKKTCDIVDLVGNVKKLGGVETIKVERLQDGWNIVSETGLWHNVELYSYVVKDN